MLNIGMTELLVFGIIALLVLGPDKLPEAVRFAGKWYGKLKRLASNVQNDIDRELRMSELKEQMQTEMKRIQDLETKMQAQMQALQENKIFNEENTAAAISDKKNLTPHYTFVDHAKNQKYALKRPIGFIAPQFKNPNISTLNTPSMVILQEAV